MKYYRFSFKKLLLLFSALVLPLAVSEERSSDSEKKQSLITYPAFPLSAEERSSYTEIADVRKTLRMKAWLIPVNADPLDVTAYAVQAKKEGFNVLLTECNRNLFIESPEDIIGQTMGSVIGPVYEDLIKNSLMASEACHQLGLKFFIHITSIMVNKNVIKAHPEWAMVDCETKKPLVNAYGTYTACINNDEFFEEYKRRLERYFKESKADGIMLDEIQFMSTTTCGCKSCAAKFKEATGLAVPDLADMRTARVSDAGTRKWLLWRSQCANDRMVELHQLLKTVNPKMIHMDYLANPTSAWAYYAAGLNVNNLKNWADSLGYEVEPPHFLYQYYTNHLIAEMKSLRAIAEKTNNEMWAFFYPQVNGDYVWNWFIAMSQGTRSWWMAHVPDREGKGSEHWLPLVSWEEKHEKLICNYVSVADTAIVYPRRTRDNLRFPDCVRPPIIAFMAVSNALIDSRIPYSVVLEEDLATPATLKKFKTLLMVNCASLSKGEVAGIKEFVQQGGNLVATSETSLYDETGEKLPDFQLAELFGFSFDRTHNKEATSFEILPAASAIGIDKGILKHADGFLKLKEVKPDVQVLGEFSDEEGRYPGLVSRPFGKGKVVYCAGHPENGYFYSYYNTNEIEIGKEWKDFRDPNYLALWKALALLGGKPPMELDPLPQGVVAELYQHKFGVQEGMAVHLVNFTGGTIKEGVVPEKRPIDFPEIKKQLPTEPKSFRVQVRLTKPSRCFVFSPDFDGVVELPVKREGEYSTVEIENIYRYSVIYFNTGPMTEIDRISKGKYLTTLPKAKELAYTGSKVLSGEYDPQATYLFADSKSFGGGKLDMSKANLGRFIYGTESGEKAEMTGVFQSEMVWTAPVLEIGGMDDNRETKASIEIQINQQTIFSGANDFPDNAWGKKSFELSADTLKKGENEIKIKTTDAGVFGGPPWFGVNYLKISNKEKVQ